MLDRLDSPGHQRRFDRRTALKLAGGALLAATVGETRSAAETCQSAAVPFDEYAQHDAMGLAELVRKQEVTPEELLEAAIARAEAVNPKINALVVTLYDEAREEIKQGLPRGPFTGVPFLVKDLGFWMKGVECSEGSQLFQGHKPPRDDTVIERYRSAGLVIFGRTHSPEGGNAAATESVLHGTTRNPWNLERTAGGSSGGSAAAVAAGVLPMASASDGGGSIRIPAACCGLFGLKPTRGRVPLGPDVFEFWDGLAVYHALTRSVRDSAALLDISAGPASGDAYWAPPPPGPFLREVGKSPGKLKVALVLAANPAVTIATECCRAAESAADLCRQMGHDVKDATQSFQSAFPWTEIGEAMNTIIVTHVTAWIRGRLEVLGRNLCDGDVEPIMRRCLDDARPLSALDMVKARTVVHRTSRQMANFQQDYDVILTPTLGTLPGPHGLMALSGSYEDYMRNHAAFIPFTPLANFTGQPAMSVPLSWMPDGLPVGVHFFGRFGDEATLFRLAAQLEQAQPWWDKRPKI